MAFTFSTEHRIAYIPVVHVLLLVSLSILVACSQETANTAESPANVQEEQVSKPATTSASAALTASERETYASKLDAALADPIARSELIVKIMGSTANEDTHTFLKFHVYGFDTTGNLVPFFTMNNYIVQKWKPVEPGHYELRHYEVAYYAKFDTNEPIRDWVNPLTGETLEIPPFILGPIVRQYTPDGIIAPGLAPTPLNISMIGDRIFIPTQSIEIMPNMLTPEEYGVYASGSDVYWDSMMVFSADVRDVFDPEKSRAPAEVHMQNLVSWAPYLRMGQTPGRTMVRAYGQHISGFEALPADIRAGLEEHTPEIFHTEDWKTMRLDSVEFVLGLQAKKAAGTLNIERMSVDEDDE